VGLYIEPVEGVADEVGKLPETPNNIGELNLTDPVGNAS